ncbi:unnamed protein product [Allacma fusca]|uniref:ubiquitinyl hydrolase 1 n=1 Tax=Allacma fusca TaxID=39272 RepID=A0A8J2JFC2_9HEXA|nr:unnamed protein product [Allacma fusca]
MDLSQLLSSGFQFLNLDDACEAEVDILTDMLFKHQDVTQLSKLFHLKSYPDDDIAYDRYQGLEHFQLALPVEHGEEVSSSDANNDRHMQGLQEPAVISSPTIPIANGPLMPLSPQHRHISSMEDNPGECPSPGEINPPMMPSLPPPLRSYYSQQHVPVVHGSPQAQVGSPGIGQHGQVGVMHQQQLIMMQPQPQAGQPYVGLQPLHYVPSQRHHGHPTHGYVQGGPSKYSSGPRKNHSRSIDRNRRNDPEIINSYPAYYPGIAYQNVAYYNQHLAQTVTGSPIIMSANHHSKAPVTMYNPYAPSHQYSSPPPNLQIPITTPNTTATPELQRPFAIPPESVVGSHLQPPLPGTPPNVSSIFQENAEEPINPHSTAPTSQIHSDHHDELPSQVENQSVVVVDAKTKGEKQVERIFDSGVTNVESDEDMQLGAGVLSPKSPPSRRTNKKIQLGEVATVSTPLLEAKPVVSCNQNESKQVNRSSPVPEVVAKKSMSKCSSPASLEDIRVQSPTLPAIAGVATPKVVAAATPTLPPQSKTQTWAETSAPKPQRSSKNSSTIHSGNSSSDEKALKEKQGQAKSTEFPALAKINVNGNSNVSTQGGGASSAPPKGRSWASICKNPNAPTCISNCTTANGGSGGPGVSTNQSASDSVGAMDLHISVAAGVNPNSSVGYAGDIEKSNGSKNIVSTDSNGHIHVTMQCHSYVNDKSPAAGDPPVDPSCLSNENDSLAIRLGEFLANYVLDHHATALTPRGLTNQSNFCYINSTLQALMACPPFVNLFRSMRDVGLAKTPCKATPIIQSVFDFVTEFEPLNRGNTSKRDRRSESFIMGANLEPSGIRKVLGLLDGSTFKVEGRQQDAEEFLSHLLNGLHDEMIKVIKWYENSKTATNTASPSQQTSVLNGQHPEEVSEEEDDADHWQVMGPKNKGCLTRKTNVIKSPISEMLFGQLCSALHRTNSFKSATLQPFFTLQLDIQSDTIRSVRDALEGLSFKEEVSGLVSNSGQETEAWRQLSLEELPMILILHLKRFVYDKSGHKILKLDKKLEFGIDLEIAKELLSVNTRGKCTLKQRQYKLFAVVYHDGEEAYKGHYIADCFHPSGGNLWGQVGWLRDELILIASISS